MKIKKFSVVLRIFYHLINALRIVVVNKMSADIFFDQILNERAQHRLIAHGMRQ